MKTKIAVVGTTAIINKQQKKSYSNRAYKSKEIYRESIGFLLLRLVAEQGEPSDWQLFDQLLRQLYARNTI